MTGGIDPRDAVVSLTDDSFSGSSVFTVPNNTDCASGQLEVDTTILEESGSTNAGDFPESAFEDAGFAVLPRDIVVAMYWRARAAARASARSHNPLNT